MGVLSLFTTAFNATQRRRWWDLYGEIGVPFTFTLVVALLILYALRWRPNRVFRYALCCHV